MRVIHKYIRHNIARAHAKRTRTRINYNRLAYTAAAAICRRVFLRLRCGRLYKMLQFMPKIQQNEKIVASFVPLCEDTQPYCKV